jgi:cyclopropane fatty-acyl-phospholipid synthase-like methyltransferase
MEKPYSAAADRNKDVILEVLKQYIPEDGRLLEIGTGTAQHAVHFASQMPKLHWVTSDQPQYHEGIKLWLKEARLPNIHGPEKLVVGKDDFPSKRPFDYVYSANTLHIMSWKEDKTLFKLLGKRLREGCLVFFYGPFNYDNQYTSESNQSFDEMLKARDSKSGIRNFEDVVNAMEKSGFKLIKDHEMPANNRTLVFERKAFT